MSTVAPAARAGAPVDVDSLLRARYLADVVEEIVALRVPVDAAVLDGPGRTGGTVVLRDLEVTAGRPRPSCARWNGRRCWTLAFPRDGGGVRRRRLRRHRLPTPQEVAQFVARFAAQPASGTRPALRWRRPVPGRHLARGH